MELNDISKSRSQDCDAAQDGSTICEAEKNDDIATTKEESNTKDAVKMEPETSVSDQKVLPGARSNLIEQTKHSVVSSDKQMQDGLISTTSNSYNADHRSIKQEKVATDDEMKTEVVLTDQQRTDAQADVSHLETNSNEVKREKAACNEEVKTEVVKTRVVSTKQQIPVACADMSHLETKSNVVKQEKVVSDEEMKTRDSKTHGVPTEQQRPDTRVDVSHLETKANDIKPEKVAVDDEMKTVVAPTEQQRSDALVDSSYLEAKSNGQRRPNAEPVNC